MKLREVDPFKGMVAAPNALIMTGAPTIVMLAFEVLPVPPSVEVTVTLLFFTPTAVPTTFTDTVQDALAARPPADRLTEEDPATAVAVPPQLSLSAGVGATVRPTGKLSVKATPLSARLAFGFCMVNVRLVATLSGELRVPNAFVIAAGFATVRFAVAVLPVPPFVDVTLPVVFVY